MFCHYKMCPQLEWAKPGDVVKYDHYWEWTDDDGRVVFNFAYNIVVVQPVVIQTLQRGFDLGWQRPNKDRVNLEK